MDFFFESPKSGVVCNYAITDHFKSSFMSVGMILPLNAENATGMSLLSGILSRGTKAFPRMDLISNYLAKNYGASFSVNASKVGEMEIMDLSIGYLDNEYAIDGEDLHSAALFLLKEMLFSPLLDGEGFNESYVAQEKKNLENKIAAQFNDKRIYSLNRCKEKMCSDEAYGISELGDLKILKDFDRYSLYAFFKKMIAESSVVLSYVGKGDEGNLAKLADAFDGRNAEVPEAELRSAPDRVQEIVDPMNLNQSKLNLGFRMGKAARENSAACRVFNILYGGSANSKLFMNVRERLSLCYYCSSTFDRFKNVMFVSSGVESAKYEQARQEIEAQLMAVATGDFTEDELENAKIYLIDSLRGNMDSKGAIAGSMTANFLWKNPKALEAEIEEVRAVCREDIIAVANEIKLDTVYFLKGVQNEE